MLFQVRIGSRKFSEAEGFRKLADRSGRSQKPVVLNVVKIGVVVTQ
jgi:hypothetical protein